MVAEAVAVATEEVAAAAVAALVVPAAIASAPRRRTSLTCPSTWTSRSPSSSTVAERVPSTPRKPNSRSGSPSR